MFFILSPMLFTSRMQPLQQCLLFVGMRFIRSDGWIFSWNSETFYIDCLPMWKNGEAIAPMHISGSSAYGLTRADVQINAERSIYFTFVVDNLLHWISLAWSHLYTTHTHTHTPVSWPFSGTTQVSWYQKGKTNLDFTEATDSEWHPLGHMQVCTSLQTDNHASTPPLSFLQAGCPSCRPTNSVTALKAYM